MGKREPQPIDILLPYQREWVNDTSRWKFGLQARQTGKDFSSGFEGIRDCYQWEAKKKKTNWLLAAPSERQSLESLEKWKEWAEIFGLAIDDYKETRESSQALLKSAEIRFPNGSRVIAVPGKPDTVRGYSANVLMTEFAFFEKPDETWAAVLPSVTNPIRGGVKKVRLITTPNGLGNKAHDLWVKNYKVPGSKWSCHFVDIYKAVSAGLNIDIEEIREAMDDAEKFSQEYECLFIDVQSVLLPYELIAACETIEASDTIPLSFFTNRGGSAPLFLGIDFGRRRDLTVAWTNELLGDVAHTREVLCLDKMPTPDQVEILRPRIQAARRVVLDYTGPGVGIGDYLVKEFGQYDPEKHEFGKIELLTFSNTSKVDVFSKLRMAFEKLRVRVPINRLIREDLHSVNRVSTPTGQVTYKAPHTADGHADRCTALALALKAGSDGSQEFAFSPIRRGRPNGLRGKGTLA